MTNLQKIEISIANTQYKINQLTSYLTALESLRAEELAKLSIIEESDFPV